MRGLIVNNSATPTGGAELMTRSLRDGPRRRGHDARVFASDAEAGQPEIASAPSYKPIPP